MNRLLEAVGSRMHRKPGSRVCGPASRRLRIAGSLKTGVLEAQIRSGGSDSNPAAGGFHGVGSKADRPRILEPKPGLPGGAGFHVVNRIN